MWKWRVIGGSVAYHSVDRWVASKIVMWSRNEKPSIKNVRRLRDAAPSEYERLVLVVSGLVEDDSGKAWKDVEKEFAENLYNGVILDTTNRKIARRNCDDCKAYFYNEETGLPIISNVTGLKEKRSGVTMCQTPEGCPKGTPENPKTLNNANGWAWRHYRDCAAVGQFPDDPIVKRNASIIKAAIEAARVTKAM